MPWLGSSPPAPGSRTARWRSRSTGEQWTPRPDSKMADETQQAALRALEERLARASQAAERLMHEAAGAGRQRKPPPSGWDSLAQEATSRGPAPELESLLAAVRSFRELIPP